MAALKSDSNQIASKLLRIYLLVLVTLAIVALTPANGRRRQSSPDSDENPPKDLDTDQADDTVDKPAQAASSVDRAKGGSRSAGSLNRKKKRQRSGESDFVSKILDQERCGVIKQSGDWPAHNDKSNQLDLRRRRGSRGNTGSSRIVGGREVLDAKQFSGYVEIIKFFGHRFSGRRNRVCGGVLLSDRVVLTAGNCFRDDFDGKKVDFSETPYLVGAMHWPFSVESDITHENEGLDKPERKFAVVDRACHAKEYYTCNIDNSSVPVQPYDVGILILKEAMIFNDNIHAVCLPNRSYIDPGSDRTAYPLYQVGAGVEDINDHMNGRPDKLKYFSSVNVPCGSTVNPKWPIACFELPHVTPGTSETRYGRLCWGDEGSPMFTRDDRGRLTLVSLVSKSFSDCKEAPRHVHREHSKYGSIDIWRMLQDKTFENMLRNCTAGLNLNSRHGDED